MDTLRWKIGTNIIVTSIPELHLVSDPSYFFADAISPADVRTLAGGHKWLDENGFVTHEGKLNWKIQAFVVDTGNTRIVVDTCVGNDKKREEVEWSGLSTDFLKRLEKAGYPPSSVDYVVCTHMHSDHVGWNTSFVDRRWVPTFSNARYLFVRQEFDSRLQNSAAQNDDVFADSVQPVYDAGLVDFVPPDHVVVPGVRLEPTPGHTPGHVSVVIEQGGHKAVITGDMLHSPIQLAKPRINPKFESDPTLSTKTRLAAFERWADGGATLMIGTHFSYPTAGLIKSVGPETYTLVTSVTPEIVGGAA